MEEKIDKINVLENLPVLNMLSIFVGAIFIISKYNLLPEKVPFFYSRPWGTEQLAEKNWLFIIPATSIAILAFSFQVSRILEKKGEKFLALTINGSAFIFSLLGAITVSKIVLLIS